MKQRCSALPEGAKKALPEQAAHNCLLLSILDTFGNVVNRISAKVGRVYKGKNVFGRGFNEWLKIYIQKRTALRGAMPSGML